MANDKFRRWKRNVRVAVALVVVLVPAGALTLWMTFQHIPGWYRPLKITDPTFVRDELTRTADDISDQIVANRPFEMTFTDAEVTSWLVTLPELYPDGIRTLPSSISEPSIHFGDDSARLGVRYHSGQLRTILNVRVAAVVGPDKRTITLSLREVRGGSLPVPRALLREVFDPMIQRHRSSRAANPLEQALEGIGSVDDLFNGVSIENRFVWPNGKRRIRIGDIRVDQAGTVTLVIEPL